MIKFNLIGIALLTTAMLAGYLIAKGALAFAILLAIPIAVMMAWIDNHHDPDKKNK